MCLLGPLLTQAASLHRSCPASKPPHPVPCVSWSRSMWVTEMASGTWLSPAPSLWSLALHQQVEGSNALSATLHVMTSIHSQAALLIIHYSFGITRADETWNRVEAIHPIKTISRTFEMVMVDEVVFIPSYILLALLIRFCPRPPAV